MTGRGRRDTAPMLVTTTEHGIPVDGGTLYARVWRPAEPSVDTDAAILLLHDSLGCVDGWRDFPEMLAATTGQRVVAYDRLGFGRSDARAGRLPRTFVRDEAESVLPRVCVALGLGALVPFGHSVGGGMAVAIAARWPERCAALVTEAAQSFVEPRTLAGIRLARGELEAPDQFERVVRRHGAKARWVLDAWTETWLDPAFADWSLDGDLAGVRCPTLVLHGDRDEYGSLAHAERIARGVPGGARLVVFEGCGHVPHREQPTRVLGEVARLLAVSGG